MVEEKRWWLWKPPKDARYIGKRRVPRKDAKAKASGKAVFCRDIRLPGMVYAKPLLSPHAHARIKCMDTRKAENVPGIVAVVRWDDPEFKGRWPTWGAGFLIAARRLLTTIPGTALPYIGEKAYFYGQPVGCIVVAENEEACDEALKLVEADTVWESLPFILDWDEAVKPGAALTWPEHNVEGNYRFPQNVWERGNVEAGFREAERIVEFTLRKSADDVWAGVEGGVAIARWIEDYCEVWYQGQNIEWFKQLLIKHMNLPENRLIVHTPYHGALFGGSSLQAQQDAIAATAVMLSKKVGRPVKLLDDYTTFRGAEFQLGTMHFKIGVKNDGTITAVEVEHIAVNAQDIFGYEARSKLWEGTAIPNIRFKEKIPYVNRPMTICYRHGAPACNVVNYVINRVAAELGMDPTEVALKNDGCEGQSIGHVYEHVAKPQGFDVSRWSLKEVVEVGKRAIGWDGKWHPPGAKRLPNGKYHGIGFMEVIQWTHTPNIKHTFVPGPSAGIRVNFDGTVEVLMQYSEGGVNRETTYCQIVADEMGMRIEDVTNHPFEDRGFFGAPMGGSQGLMSNAICLITAARKAKQLMLSYATQLDPFRGKSPDELDIKDSLIFEKANPENKVPMVRVAESFPAEIFVWSDNRFMGEAWPRETPCMVRQAHFVEVEVDPETGKVDIVNVVLVNDVGRAINPDAVNGQQYGGAYMGLGRNHQEAIFYDPLTGVRLNDSLAEYGVMLMNDIENIECHIVETGLSYGAYGMCGCSEAVGASLSMILGPAIYNAIGKWIDDFPITPDKILRALGKA
ncbi:MAG: molybdopterin cofactor-binding domain-containing protein [Candidatus Bathyarchaeia archaeon]